VLFEKFCVLALSVATDHQNLTPFRQLDIKKRFHLYGARPSLVTGQEEEYLLDWAIWHGILSRSYSDPDSSEYVARYSLAADINTTYPKEECPWDNYVKEALEDLATLIREIQNTRGLRTAALVAITSLASNQLHCCVLGSKRQTVTLP
jgi:hypothetical protein